MRAIMRLLWRRLPKGVRQLVQRLLTARARRNGKLDYVRWLASPAGPRPEPYLRSFAPGRSTELSLWVDDLCHGHIAKIRKIGRIYVPSRPPAKIRAIRWYARHYKPKFFVETGTYMGDTTAAVADLFEQCFSIELSEKLYRRSSERLSRFGNVRCIQGDSGRMVSDLIQSHLPGPTLFWLDAHASGGITTHAGYDPIFAELDAILADRETRHVILIDDARGHQVETIRRLVSRDRSFAVKNDIIRIAPLEFHA
jgi:hypothetical protein